MKRKILITLATILILTSGFALWKFFGTGAVHAPEGNFFYIHTGDTYKQVETNLVDQKIITGTTWFNWAAALIGYKNIKPGRYEIKNGMSITGLVRQLRNGQQTPVNFVITKIRTKEVLASRIGKAFECDSAQMMNFLNSPDSLTEYNLDTNTVMAAALPYTYTLRWNVTPRRVFEEFYASYKIFWTDERKEKADSLGLSPTEVSTLASIIDEETNAPSDKPYIASVYLNRVKKGWPLQADPTLKFALKNFGLRRVLNEHKKVVSPYNTYENKGLPPGPICTPALSTIDSVLNAPETNYMYFVANEDFSGTHIFTTNGNDHLKYARRYQKELNKRNIK